MRYFILIALTLVFAGTLAAEGSEDPGDCSGECTAEACACTSEECACTAEECTCAAEECVAEGTDGCPDCPCQGFPVIVETKEEPATEGCGGCPSMGNGCN